MEATEANVQQAESPVDKKHPRTTSLNIPLFVLSYYNYNLNYDEEENPFFEISTISPYQYPVSTSYTPANGVAYMNAVLDPYTDKANVTTLTPNTSTFTNIYLAYNMQTEYYEFLGTNMDDITAYDYSVAALGFLDDQVIFKYTLINTNNYYIEPSTSRMLAEPFVWRK